MQGVITMTADDRMEKVATDSKPLAQVPAPPPPALPPPPPPSRTKWTRLASPPVLIGHVSFPRPPRLDEVELRAFLVVEPSLSPLLTFHVEC